ncbi:hypothetical protein [Marinoscillum sp.]|uniref:hypothetical protein n=1 Tax=Marinoscillum sp. TaxID=2024838 RepID=UPI003BAB42B3
MTRIPRMARPLKKSNVPILSDEEVGAGLRGGWDIGWFLAAGLVGSNGYAEKVTGRSLNVPISGGKKLQVGLS